MLCKKCGNEIKEEESFCSKCGKRIKPKEDKKLKKLLYTLVITILIILGAVAIVLVTNRNTDTTDNTITNTDISQDTNNNDTQNQEKQDFKYVQEDSKSSCGKSFKNVDFESFKSNVRELWFEKELNNNLIASNEKALFGNEYGEWQKYNENNSPLEELKRMYSKSGSLNGSWIISQYIDIYYNKDKTAVIGFSISISEYYLNKIGNDKFNEIISGVIDCFDYDFKFEIQKRMNSLEIYKDFDVDIQSITTNNEKYRTFFCRCNPDNIGTNSSNENTNNDISQTNRIKQNVKYKFIGTSQQSADTDDSTYIEFINNRFELLSADSYYYMGTYVENGDNLTLNIESINLGGEEMNLSKDEIGGEIQFKGKITNSGETIVITIENEELKFEL